MSQEVQKAHIAQYSANLFVKYQQMGAKLRECVSFDGEIKGHYFYVDGVGKVTAQKKTVRHEEHSLTETPHIRRQGALETYFTADMLDRADVVRMLTNPAGRYLEVQAAALGRQVDAIIIAAATADAIEGETGQTTTPFPAADQTVEEDGDGLTLRKLVLVAEKFNKGEVPMEDRYLTVSPEALSYALMSKRLGSIDFNTQRILMEGKVVNLLGFNWKVSNLLPKTGNIRNCLAWHKGTMVLGEPESLFVRVTEVDTKHYDTQVYSSGNWAAVRRQDEGVVILEVDESASLTGGDYAA